MEYEVTGTLSHVGRSFPEVKSSSGIAYCAIRLIQIVISAVALLVTSPLMLIVAIIVKLDSPGPALFRQTRVGRNLRPFTFYKFRTFFVNAKELYPELYAYQYSPEELTQFHFKTEEDPRITRVGRWLRKSTLDELPNFWNVLKGEMDFVGPRPEIPEMLQYYAEDQLTKFAVKPGITGLAQISGRGRLSFQRTVAYDLEYAKNNLLWQDLRIILKTFKLIITRDGAF